MPVYLARDLFPILSRYDIPLTKDSVIGRGGMGVVFKAHDTLLDIDVVIKTINPSFIDPAVLRGSEESRLFFREAMTHARLGLRFPENIVRVNNYGIEDETPFFEMEFLKGGSLRDRINAAKLSGKRRGPLFDEDAIRKIVLETCAGLKVLHKHKVYHSDLKPENLLFKEENGFELKIADLGLARVAESGILTRAGINTFYGGTINYTPQNVIEKVSKANERTDIYSVGVMLYEMITRATLLWSQAGSDFINKHQELSRPAKDIIKKACQLMGRNNFSSVEQLESRLNERKSLLL
jgi:serine/threonine protein kinase